MNNLALKNVTYILTTHTLDKMPNDDLIEIVISGKSNVGKSTLINVLTNNKNMAKVSSKPGKTRAISFFDVDHKFRIVDIPGYGYANVSKEQLNLFQNMIENYFKNRENIKMVLLLLDIRRKVSNNDLMMINFINYYKKPFIIIGTKLDKANQSEVSKFEKEMKNYFVNPKIIKYSSVTKKGLEDLLQIFNI